MPESFTDPYFLCGAAGAAMSALYLLVMSRIFKGTGKNLFTEYVVCLVGMFIGAHLLYFIVGLPTFSEKYASSIYSVQSFLDAAVNASSGMVFYGGLLGAMGAVLIYCRARCLNTRFYLNVASVGFPLMHAFGRIGCSLCGCCYGIEYHGPLAITYTSEYIKEGLSDHIADYPRFPVQPLEALLELAMFVFLLILFLKTKTRYSLASLYLLIYGIVRFLDEFLRGDEIRGIWGPFSTSQWIALICIVSVIIRYLVIQKKKAVI